MADGKPTSSDPQQQYGATTYGFVNPQEQPKLPTYDDATKGAFIDPVPSPPLPVLYSRQLGLAPKYKCLSHHWNL